MSFIFAMLGARARIVSTKRWISQNPAIDAFLHYGGSLPATRLRPARSRSSFRAQFVSEVEVTHSDPSSLEPNEGAGGPSGHPLFQASVECRMGGGSRAAFPFLNLTAPDQLGSFCVPPASGWLRLAANRRRETWFKLSCSSLSWRGWRRPSPNGLMRSIRSISSSRNVHSQNLRTPSISGGVGARLSIAAAKAQPVLACWVKVESGDGMVGARAS